MRVLILLVCMTVFINYSQADTPIIAKPYYDFFRKLLVKEKKPIRAVPVRTPIKSEPTKPVIPDLKMIIHGISGEEGMRTAIVTFERDQLLLTEGQEQPGQFKVIKIDSDKITLLHIKAGKRQEIGM